LIADFAGFSTRGGKKKTKVHKDGNKFPVKIGKAVDPTERNNLTTTIINVKQPV